MTSFSFFLTRKKAGGYSRTTHHASAVPDDGEEKKAENAAEFIRVADAVLEDKRHGQNKRSNGHGGILRDQSNPHGWRGNGEYKLEEKPMCFFSCPRRWGRMNSGIIVGKNNRRPF